MQTMRLTMLYALSPILCLALVAGIATALRTHDEAFIAPTTSPAPPAEALRANRAGADALSSGDRLRITFHETIDIPGGAPGGREDADSMLRTFYQRADLSGDYTIDEEGVVSLPRLGRFQATGLSPRDLEDQLKTAFARTIGRPGDVSVAIRDRRPVYVVGAVRIHGAVKHAGHMIVLQAVALAGGLDRGLGNAAELIEGVRGQERVGKFTRQLERLLARRARLEAERSSDAAMQAPEQLIALAGKDRAEALIAAERTLLELDQTRREQQRAEALAGLSAARKEMEAMRAKLARLDEQSRIQGEHLDDLRKLEGLTTRTNLVRTRREVAEIETRRQDIQAALAVAEGRLAQAEGVLTRLSLDHAAELARSIAATEAEIADVRGALDAEGLLADPLGRGGLVAARAAGVRPVYEIVRQGPDGPAVLTAQESTPLSPGDVLKVRLEVASQAEGEPSQDPERTAPTISAR
jgi:polysaccharide biosynthesis/export protein ExoF